MRIIRKVGLLRTLSHVLGHALQSRWTIWACLGATFVQSSMDVLQMSHRPSWSALALVTRSSKNNFNSEPVVAAVQPLALATVSNLEILPKEETCFMVYTPLSNFVDSCPDHYRYCTTPCYPLHATLKRSTSKRALSALSI